jgi:hypothetical protein
MMVSLLKIAWPVFSIFTLGSAQTFQRLGACPSKLFITQPLPVFWLTPRKALGCVLPPDQTDFLAGQYFDIRLEVCPPFYTHCLIVWPEIGSRSRKWLWSQRRRSRSRLQLLNFQRKRYYSTSGGILQNTRTSSWKVELHLVWRLVRPRCQNSLRCPSYFQSVPPCCSLWTRRVHCYPQLLQWNEDRCQLDCPTSSRAEESKECHLIYWWVNLSFYYTKLTIRCRW